MIIPKVNTGYLKSHVAKHTQKDLAIKSANNNSCLLSSFNVSDSNTPVGETNFPDISELVCSICLPC